MVGLFTLALTGLVAAPPVPPGPGGPADGVPVPAVAEGSFHPLAVDAWPGRVAGLATVPPSLVLRPMTGLESAPVLPATPAPPGRQVFEYSDGYATRLKIHKIASFATVPLFVAQFLVGQKLIHEGDDADGWVKSTHGALAGGVAGLFVVNTVTGGWNLLEARKDPYHSGWDTAHGILMLVADAGFVATGLTPRESEHGGGEGSNNTHRTVAISSMGVALVSYLMMLPPFRRD